MIRRLLLALTFSVLLLQPVISANALEGLIKFKLPDKKVFVYLEIAVTDEEKTKGLMNRSQLAQNRGMVFVFRPVRKVTFWMKDTLISLDMIFINNGRIVKIAKNTAPNQTDTLYLSDFDVTEVVEVNGGFSDKNMIEIGSSVTFENISQIDYSVKSKLMIVSN